MADMEDVLNPPTEEMKAIIIEAAREDEGRLEHNLKLLETWISCQAHLPKNYEKDLLVTFLRGCKHDMQRTKKKLEGYFMTRTYEETLFRNRVMTLDRDLIVTTYGCICPLPEMTPEGYRVTLRTMLTKDDSIYSTLQFLRYELMIYDIRLCYETLSAGDVCVYDFKNLTAGHAAKILCSDFRKVLDFIQNSFPLRVKQVHMVTTNSVIVKTIGLIKQMLSSKLAKRVYIHSDWESVFKVIPQRLFPSDYGGEKNSTREIVEQWNKKFIEFEGWFQKLDEVKVSGPIPKQFEHTFSDIYGTEGSFRKMNID